MNGPVFGAEKDEPVDQVVRRNRFEVQHPHWAIWCERDPWSWHAVNAVIGDELHDYPELRDLLDALEERVSRQDA
ncbi:MAG TPA: hypothetical protein VE733_12555 [Streptosporangiaceae bacterium]|jgi:hypothetical protein|nr:hypothetical protein [Streptosporangiaceae bacterium]